MAGPVHIYWDSCVFFRYIGSDSAATPRELEQFVSDAVKGERHIYASSLVLAEVRRSRLRSDFGRTVAEFFRDMRNTFELIEPNPNILIAAGELKDAKAVNPSDPRIASDTLRVVGTADAIHLMTCLHLRDDRGIADIEFHTYDEGKGPSWEGKCIPLLGFERWFPEDQRTPLVEQVCGLKRCKPSHPQGDFWGGNP